MKIGVKMKPSKVTINPSKKKNIKSIKTKANDSKSIAALREVVLELAEAVEQLQNR